MAADTAPLLVVSGFGPFPGRPDNPTEAVAARMDGTVRHGVRIAGVRLPTEWTEAFPLLEARVRALRPDALLCLGVAPGKAIRLEVMARNAARPTADASGRLPALGPRLEIDAGAPPACWTGLPVAALQAELARTCRTPVERSPDAGSYLCNHLFFRVMHALEDVPVRGFVHVPPRPRRAGDAVVDALASLIAGGPGQG